MDQALPTLSRSMCVREGLRQAQPERVFGFQQD